MNKSKISQLFKIVFNKAVESVSTERGVLILLAIAAFVILLCCMGDNNVALATAVIVGGAEGGNHIVDGPVTTRLTNEASPSLLHHAADHTIPAITRTIEHAVAMMAMSICYSGVDHDTSQQYDTLHHRSIDTAIALLSNRRTHPLIPPRWL